MSNPTDDLRTSEGIEKIKEILREYDLWAGIIIVSEYRVHWLYHFEPSWSCMSFDLNTGEVRVRAKRADFATADEQKRVIELTTGALAATRDFAARQFADASIVYKQLEKQFEITHSYSDPQFHHPVRKGTPND